MLPYYLLIFAGVCRDARLRCVPTKLVSVSGDETKLQLHSVGALLPTKTLVTIVLCHISRDSE